jgi:phosphonatase-like hydrolase
MRWSSQRFCTTSDISCTIEARPSQTPGSTRGTKKKATDGERMSIRLTVFDVAGTTVFEGDAVIDAIGAALSAHVVAVPRPAIRAVMGMPKPVAIRELLNSYTDLGGSEIDECVRDIHSTFVEFVIERYRIDPMIRAVAGADEVFRRLRAAGISVALDTGFSRQVLDVLLQRLRWDRTVVDATITSDEVDEGRPHPHLIHRAMQLTGIVEPAEVAKIGDTPADIQEGRAAGCGLVVGVTYGTHSRAELEPFNVPLIDRLVDLLPLVGVS